jgi:phosphatidylserine/phosphatidylglycerophosphate/cardiolipin synthase-like enzyme
MGRKPLLDAINNANHSIELVMYGFTDKTLLDALIQKKNQGKTIKVILESSPYKAEGENNKSIAAFNSHDLNWQGHIPPHRLIHQKTLILDGNQAIVMTFNFTHSTFKKERNFALIIDDAQRVKAITSLFAADWNHIPNINSNPDLIISPDNSRAQLTSLINHAKNSIRIYAQNINDYKIIGALANAARRSVKVQIVTSTHMKEKQYNYLTRAGVNIHYNKKYIIHAKVFIIDNQKAVIGSINLTRPSLEDNRELSVVTQDAKVIEQLNNTFTQDWNNQSDFDIGLDDIQQLIPDKRSISHALHKLKKLISAESEKSKRSSH